MSSRDLSGFGTPPPSRGNEADPKPAAPGPRQRPSSEAIARPEPTGSPARASKQRKKKRINLSLPISVANALRAYADKQRTFYLDVIVRAHALHGKTVLAQFADAPGATPRLRQRKPLGRVQIALTIEPEALEALDRDAAAAGLDRSTFVTELLNLSVGDGRKPHR